MPEPCRSCDRREIDFGGCRCQAFHSRRRCLSHRPGLFPFPASGSPDPVDRVISEGPATAPTESTIIHPQCSYAELPGWPSIWHATIPSLSEQQFFLKNEILNVAKRQTSKAQPPQAPPPSPPSSTRQPMAVHVLTNRNNNARTGANLAEKVARCTERQRPDVRQAFHANRGR